MGGALAPVGLCIEYQRAVNRRQVRTLREVLSPTVELPSFLDVVVNLNAKAKCSAQGARLLFSNRDALDEPPVFGHVPGGGRFSALPVPFYHFVGLLEILCDGLFGKNVLASPQGALNVLPLVCNWQARRVVRSIAFSELHGGELTYAMMTADMSVRFSRSS